jgi:dTDP-4-dehydrorhamnose reductase
VRPAVEVWAGFECSYNRVGDAYFDQVARGGVYDRPDDLDRLADLGVTAMRFPVVWERVCALGEHAWAWCDEGLDRLRRRGITPIVGLVHHGSGPPGISLVDEAFPIGLAAFAREVAARYPWVRHFTPINEPLTTARFATLYGHWYPHGRSPQLFARAMIQQCRAIAAAMRAIEDVTPDAVLVQTEDLGHTYATRALQYQADFENERRWMTFDLLSGRVTGRHPMAAYLRWAGIPARELESVARTARAPDIIGINHYLTSERFLDHRLDRYPAGSHGGNNRDRYADVEAVRVLGDGIAGPYELLRETWERYGLPLAVTEAHLACTREQQLRWLGEVWDAAVRLKNEGADVRAVTAWSAFGAYDWSSLLTRAEGRYEPGLFDVRAPQPRQTALGRMVQSLAVCGFFEHPTAHAPGWWHREHRLAYPPDTSGRPVRQPQMVHGGPMRAGHSRPVLITGANGTLGRAFARACDERGLDFIPLPRQALDVTNADAVEAALEELRPWAVVNCAGFVRVDDAEGAPRACHDANVDGAAALARACAERDAKLVTFSSDLVFDGDKGSPYVESDPVRPLCEYGRTKAVSEVLVLEATPRALVVRTAAFFGDHDEFNVVTRALRALAAGGRFDAANDLMVSPTYVCDLADAALDLAIDDECGLWHLANTGALTWEALIQQAARVAHVDTTGLRGVPAADLRYAARRPRYSALTSERAAIMPTLDDALARYARSRPWERVPAPPAAIALPPTAPNHPTSPVPPAPSPTRPLPFSIG